MDHSQELTAEAQIAVNRFLYRKLIPTGTIAAVGGFILGFMINDVARATAYTDAYAAVSTQITEVATQVGRSIGQAEASVAAADTTQGETRKLKLEIEQIRNSFRDAIEKTDTVEGIASSLGENKEFQEAIIDRAAPELAEIKRQLTKTNEKLDKTAHWVSYSYRSAANRDIYSNGGKEAVHIGWQKDHIKRAPDVKQDLGE